MSRRGRNRRLATAAAAANVTPPPPFGPPITSISPTSWSAAAPVVVTATAEQSFILNPLVNGVQAFLVNGGVDTACVTTFVDGGHCTFTPPTEVLGTDAQKLYVVFLRNPGTQDGVCESVQGVAIGPPPPFGILADFTTQATGNFGLLATAFPQLKLIRGSAACCFTLDKQTALGGNAVDTSLTGDQCGIENWGAPAGQGLCVEEQRTNVIANGRDFTGAGWNSSVFTRVAQTAPDGGANTNQGIVAAGQLGGFVNAGIAANTASAFSWFVKLPAGVATSTYNGGEISAATAGQYIQGSPTAEWAWIYGGVFAGGTPNIVPLDGRAFAALPGADPVAHARSNLADMLQMEQPANFATSPILTSGAAATRFATQLTVQDVTNFGQSGQLSLYLKLIAKGSRGAANDYLNDMLLFRVDPSNLAKIVASTGVPTITVGGVSVTGTAMSWAVGDQLEMFVQCGGGSNARFRWRKNGGAAVDAINTALAGNIANAGNPFLLCNGSGNVFSCSLQTIQTLTAGSSPPF